ncbi:tyrosine-type recombinase/integrase [Geomonas diazotrophica]|uniref:tyrosine-type recombinase/integrase n=1 Tax=Geomonas diazotrophica TaxID=2843197 RepID=UPI001F305B9B|nr:site-specific integrase [Geomonas diazotrophica]
MFTDKLIKGLKPGPAKYYRREGEGFTIRVMPTGAKTWLFIYTFDAKRRELNLGSYPDVSLATARERHAAAKKLLNNGADPGAVDREAKIERTRTPFIADFVDEYVNRYAKEHNRSWREIERALKAEIVPKWGKRKIIDIKRRDLVVILDEIADRGAPVMANRVLAYTRKMFSYAVKRDVLEANPFMGMERPAKEVGRERALSVTEIKKLWENLETAKMSYSIRRALKLILVTAQRPGEVVGMHRWEIEGNWWTIPAERSKNKQAHRVFLTPLALELIGDKEGHIFESPTASGKSYEVRTMTHDIKANLPHTPGSKVEDRLKIAHFTPHDLRRTAATCMAEMGIPGDILDRVQNHIAKQKQGVGHIHNRYSYDKEKQQALEAWERKLNSIITGSADAKVLPMSRKAVSVG